MQVIIESDSAAAVEYVSGAIAAEVRNNPRAVLGFATGRTMEGVYARLVELYRRGELDFSACRTFNLDEYAGLPAGDVHSYRHYMNEHLFRHVNIDLKNTHLPDGAAEDLEAECKRYEKMIADAGGLDFQLLGIGQSGHIGFNEPLSAFRSRTRVAPLAPATIAQNAPLFGGPERMPRWAITMGVGTILDSRRCVLLATGERKAAVVAEAIEQPMTSMVPASALQLHPDCAFVLDRAASSGLKNLEYYRRMNKVVADRRAMAGCR